jgi:hypothetical protein
MKVSKDVGDFHFGEFQGVDLHRYSLILVDEAYNYPGPEFDPKQVNFYKTIHQINKVVLFTSRKLFTSENVNKAYQKIGITAAFKSYSLSENLRTSAQISKLARAYQDEVGKLSSANIQVTSTLDFCSSPPEIVILDDSSNDRTKVLDVCEKT